MHHLYQILAHRTLSLLESLPSSGLQCSVDHLSLIHEASAIRIQRFVRSVRSRVLAQRFQSTVRKCQAMVRQRLAKRRAQLATQQRAALLLQRTWRGYHARRPWLLLKKYVRGRRARQLLERMKRVSGQHPQDGPINLTPCWRYAVHPPHLLTLTLSLQEANPAEIPSLKIRNLENKIDVVSSISRHMKAFPWNLSAAFAMFCCHPTFRALAYSPHSPTPLS